jgi:hypothetical protein
MTSSAKGPGEHAVAHRGLELAGETTQGGRRRGRAALAEEDDVGASVLLVTVDRLGVVL